jgi:vacuolar-type H+-ATPase subunit E/Vma4
MTGLRDTLQEMGEGEARAVIDRARAEAAAIAERSTSRIRDELERRKAARASELAERESSARLEARGESRRSALGARQALVDRVMAAAEQLLGKAGTVEWLEAETSRVLQYLPEGKAKVRCAPRDVASVKKLVAGRARTTVAADDGIAAGVIAESADGSLTVDGTLASRLARMRGALAIEIVSAMERAP